MQVWLMVLELSTCLLPAPRENRCFLNRGEDDVVTMWLVFVLVWVFVVVVLVWFFGFELEKQKYVE